MIAGVVTLASLAAGGCTTIRPSAFPVAPRALETAADGSVLRSYDVDGDERIDFVQRLDASGRIVGLRFPRSKEHGEEVAYPPSDPDAPRLLIIFDSIPYNLVATAWRHGRFRMFPPPSRIVSPFPVMTDPCIATFVGALPVPGVEAAYVENGRLTPATSSYLERRNMPWAESMDYSLATIGHMFAYTEPDPWLDHELARIEQHFDEALAEGRRRFMAYVLSTSAIGSRAGRNGHQRALIRIDRFCNALLYKFRGHIRLTILSDHGHYLAASERVPLPENLRLAGYRVGTRFDDHTDVIVPEWGLVSTASIYTRYPAAVARDVIGFEGVELSAYRKGDAVVVCGREGMARIDASGQRLRYSIVSGDPLHLADVMATMRSRGVLDAEGFASTDDWLAATQDHEFVDPVDRLWHAFYDQFVNTPDVILSLRDGIHFGSDDLDHSLPMAATHGNLRAASSFGFVMTNAGALPPTMRMRDVATALRTVGAPAPPYAPSGDSGGGSPVASAGGVSATAAAAGSGRIIAASTSPASSHDARMSTPSATQ
ncbi:MAG: hypothetical protein D6744_17520 [Planctomycetota bacterium]|nr:MAG: hypothetical protein D6744_17520 [Planctomycetota bacterium]